MKVSTNAIAKPCCRPSQATPSRGSVPNKREEIRKRMSQKLIDNLGFERALTYYTNEEYAE